MRNFSMGAAPSCVAGGSNKIYSSSPDEKRKSDWKLLLSPVEAKQKYLKDQSLLPDCSEDQLECRSLLDDMIACDHLVTFEHSVAGKAIWMKLWKSFSAFKNKPSFRREAVLSIIENLVKLLPENDPDLAFIGKESNRMTQIVNIASEKVNDHVLDVFQKIQAVCVRKICSEVFVPFRDTLQYDSMCDAILDFYNSVVMDDFEYFGLIGEGKTLLN